MKRAVQFGQLKDSDFFLDRQMDTTTDRPTDRCGSQGSYTSKKVPTTPQVQPQLVTENGQIYVGKYVEKKLPTDSKV